MHFEQWIKGFCLAVLLFYCQGVAASNEPNPQAMKKISRYLLPYEHPIKEKLDGIFGRSRVLLNLNTIKKAGFINAKPRKHTHLIVTSHPNMQGYIFKLYLDAQYLRRQVSEEHFWLLRIRGARAIKKEIIKNHWEHLFCVPKKWIYLLPKKPSAPQEYFSKHTILVEQDMQLCPSKTNIKKWAQVTPDVLDKLFYLLETLGLHDCAKPDNIPFTEEGKIAFIDTQTHQEWPVAYDKLTHYLSPEMQKYWKKLTVSAK